MFLGRRVPPPFDVRVVTVAPGAKRAYDDAEWRDAIVSVERGELELECVSGGRRRFRRGSVLWLSGLTLRALRNSGRDPVLLVAVSRRTDESPPARVSGPLDTNALFTKEAHAMAGNFVWFDLRSKDAPLAEDFYAKLLGWDIQRDGEGPAMIAGESGPWAAIVPHRRDEAAWVPYVQVDDLHEATMRAIELGATVLQEPAEGPAGRYATIRDTGGAPVALWQPRS